MTEWTQFGAPVAESDGCLSPVSDFLQKPIKANLKDRVFACLVLKIGHSLLAFGKHWLISWGRKAYVYIPVYVYVYIY